MKWSLTDGMTDRRTGGPGTDRPIDRRTNVWVKVIVFVSFMIIFRYSDKPSIQKKIEGSEFAPGWTMTALAMEKAFEQFSKEQRTDGTTARVRHNC